MKFRILAYLFFFVGIADLFIKIFYGNIFSDFTEDYYEIANPILVFTPVLFFSIGGIFLKESKVSLTLENFGTSRIKYYSPQFICLSVVVLIFLFCIEIFSPTIRLINVDLPAFVLPTKLILSFLVFINIF